MYFEVPLYCKMSIKKKITRIVIISFITWIFFSYVLIPLRIQGKSMEPTYHDGGFSFCWRQRFLLSQPNRGDVVAIRLAGRKVMLLKSVVALSGETVEFRNGRFLVNGRQVNELYV